MLSNQQTTKHVTIVEVDLSLWCEQYVCHQDIKWPRKETTEQGKEGSNMRLWLGLLIAESPFSTKSSSPPPPPPSPPTPQPPPLPSPSLTLPLLLAATKVCRADLMERCGTVSGWHVSLQHAVLWRQGQFPGRGAGVHWPLLHKGQQGSGLYPGRNASSAGRQ